MCVGGEEPFGVKSGHGIDNSLIATHWGIPSCVKPGVLRVFMAVKGLRSWAFRNICCGKSQARDLVLPVEAVGSMAGASELRAASEPDSVRPLVRLGALSSPSLPHPQVLMLGQKHPGQWSERCWCMVSPSAMSVDEGCPAPDPLPLAALGSLTSSGGSSVGFVS